MEWLSAEWLAELVPGQDRRLLAALIFGQAFKIVCVCWSLDSATSEPLKFPRCLFKSPERYRTAGSWMLTLCYVFVLPDTIFKSLLDMDVLGLNFGYFPVVILGFISDDLFVLIPAVVSAKLREIAAEKLGINLNGKPKKLPDDFPK